MPFFFNCDVYDVEREDWLKTALICCPVLYYLKFNDKLKFFVVDREIPVMYPLELRDKEIEGNFINRNKADCEKMNISKPYEI